MKNLIIAGLIILVLSGCAQYDCQTCTDIEPIKCDKPGMTCFKYISFADAVYPLEDQKAEDFRLYCLERWLKKNGFDNPEYIILSRKPVLKSKAMLGDVYKVYYEVQVNN